MSSRSTSPEAPAISDRFEPIGEPSRERKESEKALSYGRVCGLTCDLMEGRVFALTGIVAIALAVASAIGTGGCGGPKYPSCDDDTNCNAEGHRGVCVDHKCVACRDDKG